MQGMENAAARKLSIHLLDGFALLDADGVPVRLANRKAAGLLAYLALSPNSSETRERLAGLLWSETGDERARHNLRQALAKIRRSYGEVLRSRGDAVQIDLDACSLDVAEFERLAESNEVLNALPVPLRERLLVEYLNELYRPQLG